jgi:hypothetical protein
MATYKVVTRPLNHNGRRVRVGWKVELGEADGAVLVRLGRVERYERPVRRRRAKA